MSWFRREHSENRKQTFRLGDSVSIKSGPFAGFKGTVEGINQAKRLLKVAITIFGRAKPVKLNFLEVEKLTV